MRVYILLLIQSAFKKGVSILKEESDLYSIYLVSVTADGP